MAIGCFSYEEVTNRFDLQFIFRKGIKAYGKRNEKTRTLQIRF